MQSMGIQCNVIGLFSNCLAYSLTLSSMLNAFQERREKDKVWSLKLSCVFGKDLSD